MSEELIEKMAREIFSAHSDKMFSDKLKYEWDNGNPNDDAYKLARCQSNAIFKFIKLSGYSIVPNEPTSEMSKSGKSYLKGTHEKFERTIAENIYKLMLKEGAL